MPIVHRNARTDHLPSNSLEPRQMELLSDLFCQALESQEFMRVLVEQVGAIADRRPAFRKLLRARLKASSTGARARHPAEIFDVLADLAEAKADGLTRVNALEFVALKHSKSVSTIEDIEKAGRELFGNLHVVRLLTDEAA